MKIIVDNNNSIEKAIQVIHTQLLSMCPGKKRSASAAMLATEEIMLLYKERLEDFRASAEIIRDIRRLAVRIEVFGKEFSPETILEEEKTTILKGILKNSDLKLEYTYKAGCNVVLLTVEKYAPFRDNVRFTYKCMRKDAKYLFKGSALLIVSMFCNLCIPVATAKLIGGYTENAFSQVVLTAIMLLILRLLHSVTIGLANISYNKIFYTVRANLETDLAGKILAVSEECFDENGTGPFIRRITDDLTFIAQGLETIVNKSVVLIQYLGVFVATCFLDWRIFLCELFTAIILGVIEMKRSEILDKNTRVVYEAEEKRAGLITDIINGESDIKLLNGNSFFRDRMHLLAEKAKESNNYKIRKNRIVVMLGEGATAICYFGTMVLLGYYLYIGEYNVAKALVLFNYFTMIGTPFFQDIQLSVEFCRNFNLSCERVRNLQEGTEFPKESYGTLHLPKVMGEITLEHVSFSYNHENILEKDQLVIKDVSLKIKPGETTAIIGRSGSGKSTLLRLMSKQRNCSSGRILIDGNDIEELDQETLRGNMMVISQSPYLFNASVKDNLLIAKPGATMEELERVCETACVLEDIKRMEHGFDTVLGERGIRMSGGQKQRLAIARGLLKGAKIILFDEATSAIDNIIQAKIKDALLGMHGDYTVVMIAHRLSTIIDADRIVLIDDGRILAEGTHTELMQNCPAYCELYNAEK